MDEHTRKNGRLHGGRPGTLGALIHEAVRRVIEVAVEEELTAALGAVRYARDVGRGGYRNGHRSRALTGPTGPLALTLPRATLFTATSRREWTSALVPRYQRRLREVNEAVVATYLAGANSRRLRLAFGPLLRAAPLSKSAVSRVVGTLKAELEAWRTRSLAGLDVFGLVPRCDRAASAERWQGRQRTRARRGGRPDRWPEGTARPGPLRRGVVRCVERARR